MTLRLSRTHRLLVGLAAISLGVAYVVPLWSVTLVAPQYPEGLGMHIWINTVTGIRPEDLGNINGLNHYIGMKPIEPDSIAELRVMPYLLAALIGIGLTAAALGRRWLLHAFAVTFVLGAGAGLVDFWRWEYDYGHNLDLEHAAIQVPGMSYQPPLIGSKQLLNFVATSWPAAGGWVAIGALALVVVVVLLDVRGQRLMRRQASRGSGSLTSSVALALVVLVFVGACAPAPPQQLRPTDTCSHCRMAATDLRYAAQLRTSTGKDIGFDSIECLRRWLIEHPEVTVAGIWVTNALAPDQIMPTGDALLLEGGRIRSPMGGQLLAVPAGADAQRLQEELGAKLTTWAAIAPQYRSTAARP